MYNDMKASAVRELFDSIKFFWESKRGKYSLDTYLDIIGEYTDRLIKESEEKEKLSFSGGECEAYKNTGGDKYTFSIKMYFESPSGEKIMKEAERSIEKSRFTSDTEGKLENKKIFEITGPG